MRRAFLVAVMAVSTLYAAPVQAQGWRWLERLSGPGDFTGFEVDVKLLCEYDPAPASDTGGFAGTVPCVLNRPPRSTDARTSKPVDGIVDLGRRHYALGMGISYLRGDNDLPYPATATHVDRTIQLWTFEGLFDHRLTDRVDGGIALGANVFVVPAHENFVRWSVEPRVTLKMFDLRSGPRNLYMGTASVRLGVLAFFHEFDDRNFGALPGSYRSGPEVGPSIRFIFDFDRNPFRSN